MKVLNGTGVALVTPFNEDGSIDFDGLKNLLNHTQSVDYYVVMGTTGESPTVSKEEKSQVLSHALKYNNGTKPVVYGIGGNSTSAVLSEIESTDLTDVTAILSVSPYYNKPSQEGIVAHYTAIADKSPVPIILYNVPGRTMSNLSAETTIRLSKHENIIGTKEAAGDLEQCQQIRKAVHPDFLIISGDDLLTTDIIQRGGNGVISVLANAFPTQFNQLVNTALQGDFSASMKVSDSFNSLNPLLYEESNPVGIKEVLRQQEVCGGEVRLPLLRASETLKSQISRELELL